MMKTFFLFVAGLFFANTAVFGCSLGIPPVTGFDPEHYVFIGEIVEIVEDADYRSRKIQGKAIGFKIKVSENVYSPKQAAYFEVYPLRLTANCGLESDAENLRKQFAVGNKVRVIAKATIGFEAEPGESSVVRLETSIYNRGSFARNDLSENLQASARSVYDYRGYEKKEAAAPAEDASFASNYYLPEFELRKDLLRLKQSKSEDEKIEILERLVFYPHVYGLNYRKVARTFIQNAEKLTALEKQWELRPGALPAKPR